MHFTEIRTIISEHKVDLVVMGTQGRNALEDKIIGTLTERVIRHSRCPVMSVSRKPSTMNYKNIVYATALSRGEEKFSRFVKLVMERMTQTIHLVWINTWAFSGKWWFGNI